jgi:drug/metabolite transporter (DMT)-like permease
MNGSLWFYFSLGSSILWGLSYCLSEKLVKGALSPSFYMFFTGVIYTLFALSISVWQGTLRPGFAELAENKSVLLLVLFTSACYALGSFLIYMAISMKNATLANIIEITYPLFTLLFAYIIFREIQLNIATMAGAGLVIAGVTLIALKS